MADIDTALGQSYDWNLYDLSEDNPEHRLFDSHIVEKNDIGGFVIEYYRLNPDFDQLYGEDPNEQFSSPKVTKATFMPSEEDLIIQAFGLSMDDNVTYLQLPKTTFLRDIIFNGTIPNELPPSATDPTLSWPKVGDVIKVLYNERNYEIVDVGHEEGQFLAKKFVWQFILRPFRFSEQSDSHQEIEFGQTFSEVTSADSGSFPLSGSTTAQDIVTDQVPIIGNDTLKEFGDNDYIHTEAKKIYDYEDDESVDASIYGFSGKGTRSNF